MRRRGPRLTAAQKAELWRRWRQGESLTASGRALGRIPKMVHYVVAGAGGIPPVPRQRARQALTLSEREVISRGVARGVSLRQISRDLGRTPAHPPGVAGQAYADRESSSDVLLRSDVSASVVRQTDGALFSARLARVTLARMSDAFFVQMNGLGASLC